VFFAGSRYATVAVAEIGDGNGRPVQYKRVRLIPPVRALQVHVVNGGERLDVLAYAFFRDPERFWRVCDVNRAMRPDDLVAETGRQILVPAADG
jgi:hypothetical protein